MEEKGEGKTTQKLNRRVYLSATIGDAISLGKIIVMGCKKKVVKKKGRGKEEGVKLQGIGDV
jgi:hypothetical protein